MSIGAFIEKNRAPKAGEIAKALGHSHGRWQSLIEYLRASPGAREDLAFLYGKGYGWALRFRLKGRLLTSLFPNFGFFTVQVNLGTTELTIVDEMKLHKSAKAAIKAASLYTEGKWVFASVHNDGDLRDAIRLIELKTGRYAGSPAKGGRAPSRSACR